MSVRREKSLYNTVKPSEEQQFYMSCILMDLT